MDFIGGALPNVMFIVGIMAIGIGLGIEFKIVEVKGELSKGGRIGAFGVGAALIVASIILYSRPATTATSSPTAVAAQATATINTAAQVSAAQPTGSAAAPAVQPTAAPAAVEQPTAEPPTAIPPTATATAVPPTATPVPDLGAMLQQLFEQGKANNSIKKKDADDLIKKTKELTDAINKNDAKAAGDRLRELQDRVTDDKKNFPQDIVDSAMALIQQIATQYNLPLPSSRE